MNKYIPIGKHKLPPLPYEYSALEPYIDRKTMQIHHDIHHKSYVDGLNKAEIELQRVRKYNNYSMIKYWERELAFNGAGHYLHSIFWNNMSPKKSEIDGPIVDELKKSFGSITNFKRQFSEAASKVEGSGWAALVWSIPANRLEILQFEKHQNLSQQVTFPLLVLDVWEHAYYLKYQNKRKEYINAWWNIVNWENVNQRLKKIKNIPWP